MMAFFSIFALGLVFFASPGPINIETVRRGVNSGPWPAFFVQLGAVLAELVVGVAVLFGLAPLMQRADIHLGFTLLSAGVLLWIAWVALRDARQPVSVQLQVAASRHSLVVGMVCAASSPLSAMMWLSIAGIATAHGVAMTSVWTIGFVGLGYFLGALTWAVLISAFIGWSRAVVKPRFWRYWNAVSGVILGGYGVHLLWQTL